MSLPNYNAHEFFISATVYVKELPVPILLYFFVYQ